MKRCPTCGLDKPLESFPTRAESFFLGIRAGLWPAVRPGHWGAYQAARAEVEAGRVDKRLASHD